MDRIKYKYTLTNREIMDNFSGEKFYLTMNDFRGALAYWISSQQLNVKIDINKPLDAFCKYLKLNYFKNENVIMLSYSELNNLISEQTFINIPEILKLNQIDNHDFYDLSALARNVFFMICREQISQPL